MNELFEAWLDIVYKFLPVQILFLLIAACVCFTLGFIDIAQGNNDWLIKLTVGVFFLVLCFIFIWIYRFTRMS